MNMDAMLGTKELKPKIKDIVAEERKICVDDETRLREISNDCIKAFVDGQVGSMLSPIMIRNRQ